MLLLLRRCCRLRRCCYRAAPPPTLSQCCEGSTLSLMPHAIPLFRDGRWCSARAAGRCRCQRGGSPGGPGGCGSPGLLCAVAGQLGSVSGLTVVRMGWVWSADGREGGCGALQDHWLATLMIERGRRFVCVCVCHCVCVCACACVSVSMSVCACAVWWRHRIHLLGPCDLWGLQACKPALPLLAAPCCRRATAGG